MENENNGNANPDNGEQNANEDLKDLDADALREKLATERTTHQTTENSLSVLVLFQLA